MAACNRAARQLYRNFMTLLPARAADAGLADGNSNAVAATTTAAPAIITNSPSKPPRPG